MNQSDSRRLFQLARHFGIQTSYLDMAQKRRPADAESVWRVLLAMGAEVNTFADLKNALAAKKESLRRRKVEPVIVAWDGKLNGRRLEYGYHDIEINGHETFVISAPVRAYFPLSPEEGSGWPDGPHPMRQGRVSLSGRKRVWGLFAPVYALHSKRNPYAGDLTDFGSFIEWMGELGGSVAATLPLLASFFDEPFEPSPYSPASRLFWSDFYIDFTRIPEFSNNLRAKRLAERLPGKTRLIDYKKLMAYKRRVLEELARTFHSDTTKERHHDFRKFVRTHHGIEDYARFRAATDRLRTGWNSWPARLRDGNLRAGDYEEATKHYHMYSQWIVQEHLGSLSQKARSQDQLLYLDLPLGLHKDGYDIWRNREWFVRGVSTGAPPDRMFTQGQNWEFPPMHPRAMRINKYQYYIAAVQNHLRYARLLRIDHVMGLHRLFWIPEGLTGDKGVYVEYPADELYAILSLESHRYRAGIVGENLGMVPPAVNVALVRHNIARMYVAQYEMVGNPDKPLRRVPSPSVASLNTHDMPPFRAVLKPVPELSGQEKSSGKPAEPVSISKYSAVFRRTLGFLAESKADIVLVNVEDLWGEVHPQNVPATTSKERPNWRRRMRPGIEQMRKMRNAVKVLSDVFAKRSRSLSF